MLQQLHLPFPAAQGGLGRKASTNSGCGIHFSIFFFCHLYRARPGHPLPYDSCYNFCRCVFVAGASRQRPQGQFPKSTRQGKHLACDGQMRNIFPSLRALSFESSCSIARSEARVLSHHPQPSTPPPPPPSSPTHLMWHFVARAEAAVSTVILIFK